MPSTVSSKYSAIALLSILIKDLNRSEKPLTIVFYFAAFTTPLLAFGLPFVDMAHDMGTWLLILAMGLCGLVGQMLSSTPTASTLPVSLYQLGLALSTLPAAWLMHRAGRRPHASAPCAVRRA